MGREKLALPMMEEKVTTYLKYSYVYPFNSTVDDQTSDGNMTTPSSTLTGAIAAGVAAASGLMVLTAVILLVVTCLLLRRRAKKKASTQPPVLLKHTARKDESAVNREMATLTGGQNGSIDSASDGIEDNMGYMKSPLGLLAIILYPSQWWQGSMMLF